MAHAAMARVTDRFERKRVAILDAATELLNSRGVKGLTLAEAAAAVGLSTTSVTYYFKRKDDLAAACMQRGLDSLNIILDEALAATTPEARLRALIGLYFDRLQSAAVGAETPMPAFSEVRALNDPQRSEVVAALGRPFRRVRQIFDAPELAWLSRGRRTARTAMILEQLLWAPSWLPRYEPADYRRVGEQMLDILIRGMAGETSRWEPEPISIRQLAPRDKAAMSRETFLLAATRLINARGYLGASVDKISAELNVTKGSFYHHNDAKDDLVVACFDRTFEVMTSLQDRAMALRADQWTKLVSVAAAVAEHQLSPFGPLLRTSVLTALPESIRARMIERSERISGRFATMISDVVAEGSIRAVDPFIAGQMLNATLNAGSELGFLLPDISQKAAAAVFVRPLMTGVLEK